MDDKLSPRCGRLLIEARRRHGLTQATLADRAGVAQTNISRIERNKVSPTLATLERLLNAMGETLAVEGIPLDEPPPGGGNRSIRDLRRDYERLGPGQRLEETAALSRAVSELAAGRAEPGP